jgi:hypothetical protein
MYTINGPYEFNNKNTVSHNNSLGSMWSGQIRHDNHNWTWWLAQSTLKLHNRKENRLKLYTHYLDELEHNNHNRSQLTTFMLKLLNKAKTENLILVAWKKPTAAAAAAH